MATDFSDKLNALPKPVTAEEQYWYALAHAAAGVDYKTPFDKPFWRTQQYMYTWWEILTERLYDLNIPDDNTVTDAKILDGTITMNKFATSVQEELREFNTAEMSALKKIITNA